MLTGLCPRAHYAPRPRWSQGKLPGPHCGPIMSLAFYLFSAGCLTLSLGVGFCLGVSPDSCGGACLPPHSTGFETAPLEV